MKMGMGVGIQTKGKNRAMHKCSHEVLPWGAVCERGVHQQEEEYKISRGGNKKKKSREYIINPLSPESTMFNKEKREKMGKTKGKGEKG